MSLDSSGDITSRSLTTASSPTASTDDRRAVVGNTPGVVMARNTVRREPTNAAKAGEAFARAVEMRKVCAKELERVSALNTSEDDGDGEGKRAGVLAVKGSGKEEGGGTRSSRPPEHAGTWPSSPS